MRSVETAFLLLLAAFLAGFCALGLFYYDYSLALMRFPLLAAGGTLVVVIVQVVALRRGTAPMQVGATPAIAPGGERRRVREALLLLSVLPMVFLLGFPAGLAVYLLGVLRCAGETWGFSLAAAAASLGLSYGIFVKAMGVPLPLLPYWWPY
ncbi:hypothetical protein [Pelagibius marinus]|uniref:hypothetical protein n=1 Tax=Pelagibius marinus TaxID=2762760 RepID=UPI001872936E|nr:hypothetical protein [Pelagibius marinus]